jgi:hypothetical protein
MSNHIAPSIFSRLLMVVAGLLVIVFTYWMIATLVAPGVAPTPPGSRGSVIFDAKLDVSRNETFFRMRPLGPLDPNRPTTGRPNPFVPPVAPTLATSTLPALVPTTTEPIVILPTTSTSPELSQ